MLTSLLQCYAQGSPSVQAIHTSEIGKWVPAFVGNEKSSVFGHAWVVSVELLLALFHLSFCSWAIICKTGSDHFRRKNCFKNPEL